jgi:predicted secreted protein
MTTNSSLPDEYSEDFFYKLLFPYADHFIKHQTKSIQNRTYVLSLPLKRVLPLYYFQATLVE